jgi:hypothetical protein
MMPLLIFLLFIIVLGAVLYVHLRRVQNKVIPKDKYDEAWNKFYKGTTKLNTLSSQRSYQLWITFCAAIFATGVITAFRVFSTSGSNSFLLFILFGIFFIPLFPIGLPFGYFIYVAIFLIGIFTKNRRVFSFIYIAFIVLLIINIAGCANIVPNIGNAIRSSNWDIN